MGHRHASVRAVTGTSSSAAGNLKAAAQLPRSSESGWPPALPRGPLPLSAAARHRPGVLPAPRPLALPSSRHWPAARGRPPAAQARCQWRWRDVQSHRDRDRGPGGIIRCPGPASRPLATRPALRLGSPHAAVVSSESASSAPATRGRGTPQHMARGSGAAHLRASGASNQHPFCSKAHSRCRPPVRYHRAGLMRASARVWLHAAGTKTTRNVRLHCETLMSLSTPSSSRPTHRGRRPGARAACRRYASSP